MKRAPRTESDVEHKQRVSVANVRRTSSPEMRHARSKIPGTGSLDRREDELAELDGKVIGNGGWKAGIRKEGRRRRRGEP